MQTVPGSFFIPIERRKRRSGFSRESIVGRRKTIMSAKNANNAKTVIQKQKYFAFFAFFVDQLFLIVPGVIRG